MCLRTQHRSRDFLGGDADTSYIIPVQNRPGRQQTPLPGPLKAALLSSPTHFRPGRRQLNSLFNPLCYTTLNKTARPTRPRPTHHSSLITPG
ncbi:MAG: hypothetical protein AB1791_20975 [Chloroflexota bacterium]